MERKRDATGDNLSYYKLAAMGIVIMGVVSLSFILFLTNSNMFHPTFARIVLLVVIIWRVVALWRSSRALKAAIVSLRYEKLASTRLERANPLHQEANARNHSVSFVP